MPQWKQFSGIWTATQQAQAKGAGTWPILPGAPTIGTATEGSAQASVAFTAPADTGYPTTLTYEVTSSPGSITATGSASPITVTGLTNDTSYTFTVTATNDTGTGPASAASNAVTPVVTAGLYGWGQNQGGELGLIDSIARSSPTQITSATNWSVVHSAFEHTAAVKRDGTLWTWGSGSGGRGGRNSTTSASSPTQVGALTNWSYVDTGEGMCAALKTDGTLWTWGGYFNGVLGTNDDVSRSSPVQVGGTDWAVVAAGNAVLAVKTDGTLWGWGRFTNNGLGSSNSSASSPTQIGSDTDWATVGGAGQNDSAAFAIKTSGAAYYWGGGDKGQRGDDSHSPDFKYTGGTTNQLGALTNWSSINCTKQTSLAIKTDGTLWSWGFDDSGVLGQNTNGQNRSSPTQIGSLTTWDKAFPAYGNFAFAIKTDKTLWAWGTGDKGELGNNQSGSVRVSSPIQVGAITTWSYIGGGSEDAFGVENS
tara:strand:- start:3 stop:1436 length:1434 start_codon:yes stop_codon:yes gene_type:complete